MFSFYRVPLILNQAARFNFGLASNMVLLLWCISGGLLLHMFEANFLTILVAPRYKDFIDTAQDIIDRGFSVQRKSQYSVEMEKNSSSSLTRQLAELSIVPKVSNSYLYIEKLEILIQGFGRK